MECMSDTNSTAGEIVRDSNGRWVVPPKSPAPITHANAREMQMKRWDRHREAAARGVVKEAMAISSDVRDEYDAWGVINGRLFVEMMDKPRGDDIHRLGQAIGALPLPYERGQMGESAGVIISEQAFGQLVGLIQSLVDNRHDKT